MRLLHLDGRRHEKLERPDGQLTAGIKQDLETRGVEVVLDEAAPADVGLYLCPPYSIQDRSFDFPVGIFTMHELDQLTEGKEDWPEGGKAEPDGPGPHPDHYPYRQIVIRSILT